MNAPIAGMVSVFTLRVEPIAITSRLARLHATLGPKLDSIFERFGIRGGDFAVIATLVRVGDGLLSRRRLVGELLYTLEGSCPAHESETDLAALPSAR